VDENIPVSYGKDLVHILGLVVFEILWCPFRALRKVHKSLGVPLQYRGDHGGCLFVRVGLIHSLLRRMSAPRVVKANTPSSSPSGLRYLIERAAPKTLAPKPLPPAFDINVKTPPACQMIDLTGASVSTTETFSSEESISRSLGAKDTTTDTTESYSIGEIDEEMKDFIVPDSVPVHKLRWDIDASYSSDSSVQVSEEEMDLSNESDSSSEASEADLEQSIECHNCGKNLKIGHAVFHNCLYIESK